MCSISLKLKKERINYYSITYNIRRKQFFLTICEENKCLMFEEEFSESYIISLRK